MKIIATGINHKTAPIEVREQFFLTATQQDLLLSELKNRPEVCEALVLSTCNRTEVYLSVLDSAEDIDFLLPMVADIKAVPKFFKYKNYFYAYVDEKAVEHLFAVAAGLDSLVLGENQILAQIKSAVERAREKAMLSRQFNILVNMALRMGKKARTETDINYGGSSVSWASIAMAEREFGDLNGRPVLIIGAGKMGELALNQICAKNGSGKVYIMNRTEQNAQDLAQRFPVEPVSFYDIKDVLNEVDLCICSSGAPHYVLERKTVEKIMVARNSRPLVLIDISVPRNIDPEVGEIENVTLFMIDDLDKIMDKSMRKRQAAVTQVEHFVHQKVTSFYRKLQKLTDPDGLTVSASRP